MGFFEAIERLDELKKIESPSITYLKPLQDLIKGDSGLTLYFYDKLNPTWLELLEGMKEFEKLDAKESGPVERYKALYLFECAKANPEAVLRIIQRTRAKDEWIQGKLTGAIAEMPEQIAVKGVPVVLDYIGPRERMVWFFAGEEAAKLMVKLLERHQKEAFEIARLLLDVWRPEKKEAGVFETIRSKYVTHEYKELIFDYYSKMWGKRPFEATHILVDIYDKYLAECIKEKNYDVSEYLGVSLRDLEDIQRLDRDLDAIITKAICEAGRDVIVKEPQNISELLEDLEKRNKGIFHRVEMYLLRFVALGKEKDRINKIVSDQKFIESPLYKYEHRYLLNDRFDEISAETKEKFIEWVKQQKNDENRKKEIQEWCTQNNKPLPDFEKWDNQIKAKELYLVRERFNDLYEEYKKKSGVGDDALAPRRMVSETRCVSPMENTPLSLEEMGKKSCDDVLDYILNPSNYEKGEKTDDRHWDSPKYGLSEAFKNDVKQRLRKYLSCDLKKLLQLGPYFLSRFFYGLHEAIRAKDTERDLWTMALGLASEIVKKNGTDKEYETCFSAILSTFHDAFSDDDKGIEFIPERVKMFWEMLEILTKYPIGDISRFGDDQKDPIQIQCNFVPGQAMELTVPLGIVCKKYFIKLHDEYLRNAIRRCYERILNDIRVPGVNCTFGLDFSRIYWTDSEWIKDNLEKIFCDELWDETWGTYVSWGSPSPQGFKLLIAKGIYGRAVDRIGSKSKYKSGKEPDEGLVEHLMIGYFNEWINFESDVLKEFFKKAPTELRGKAAEFLTTGFKSVKEEGKPYDEIAERMRTYWKGRLAAIKDKPKENEKEAIGFAEWVDDSVLPAQETLELLAQSLEVSGGKIGENRNAGEFVKEVCALGKGNEALALSCLKRAVVDKNMHVPWSRIEKPIVEFLGGLPADLRSEGREVADLYGRYNPDKFRGVWEKLK